MEITLLLIKKIVSLFIVMFLGVLMVKLKLVKSTDSKVISMVVLYLMTPCVILNAYQVEYSVEVRNGLLLAALASVIAYGLWFVMIAILKKPLKLDAIEQCSVLYTNACNLIIPIVTSVLGAEMIIYSTAFLSVQTVLMFSHCRIVFSGEPKIDWKKILTNINLICVFVGALLFAFQVKLPNLVVDTMSSTGACIGPVSMVVIGMIIGGMNFKKMFSYNRAWLVTFLRLIVFPLAMLAVLKFSPLYTLLSNGQQILLVTFLSCTAPCASTVTQMAQIYGRDYDYAGAINVITTLLSIISMPLMVMLYQL
ncbi:MAG: AEC family transporter [Clostridia bacterium]|nr:AEC family transporter [Clostridia bacterium]